MRVPHAAAAASVRFDDPNLLTDGGLLPVMGLAQKLDVAGLVDEQVTIRFLILLDYAGWVAGDLAWTAEQLVLPGR